MGGGGEGGGARKQKGGSWQGVENVLVILKAVDGGKTF